jgi:hypothetical protein
MDQSAKGWLYKTARAHFWRVASWYEFNDLVQDGFFTYHRIVTRYPNVTEPKHRMRLFQTAFTNHIHDLSKKRTNQEFELTESVVGLDLSLLDTFILPDTSEMIATLPPKLRQCIDVIQNKNKQRYRHKPGRRETHNERLCRLIGAEPQGVKLLDAIRQYLDPLEPGVKTSAV